MKAEELTFPKTSRHHSGVYTCSADNGWGSAAQARIVLDVQVNLLRHGDYDDNDHDADNGWGLVAQARIVLDVQVT